MNRSSRRVLMVAFVATALCADRVVAAGPALRDAGQAQPNLSGRTIELMRTMVGRLMGSLRHGVVTKPWQGQDCVAAASRPMPVAEGQTRSAVHQAWPDHQYRMPPPAV